LLARKHVPQRIDADVLFLNAAIKGEVDLSGQLHDKPEAWRPYVDGWLDVHDVACHHQAMLDAEYAAHVGKRVMQRLHALESIRIPAAAALPVMDAGQPFAESAAYA
jgi:enterobactin synthetase component F